MLTMYSRFRDLNTAQMLQVYREAVERDYTGDSAWESPAVSFLEDLKLLFCSDRGSVAVWDCDGEYVSALRLEPYRDGFLISCLETAPCRRRQGYAHALLVEVTQLWPGPYYVHIAKSNFPSIKLHENAGFLKIADHAVYVDGSVYTSSITMKLG